MTIHLTTLRSSPSDPRFVLTKEGWDGTPREFVSQDIQMRPMWSVGYSPDAWGREDNEIACVTNFEGEGPMATVRFGETECTISAATLDDLYEKVIATYRELEAAEEKAATERREADAALYSWEDDFDASLDPIAPRPDPTDDPYYLEDEFDTPRGDIKPKSKPAGINETYFHDFTESQHKEFKAAWIADFIQGMEQEVGEKCSKRDAELQFNEWLNQEGWHRHDMRVELRLIGAK